MLCLGMGKGETGGRTFRQRQQHEQNREDSSHINRNRSRSDKEREKEREAMDINGHVDLLILRFW